MKKKYKFDYRIKTYAVRFHPAILPPWASHQRAKHVLPPRWYIIVFGATQDWPGPSLPDQTLPGQNLTKTFFFKLKVTGRTLGNEIPKAWNGCPTEEISHQEEVLLVWLVDYGRGTQPRNAQLFFFFFTVLYVVWVRWKTFIFSHHLVLNKFQHKFHLFICFLLQRSLVCLLELYQKQMKEARMENSLQGFG